MHIPTYDQERCKCGTRVVNCATPAARKQTKVVVVEAEPDRVGDQPRNQVVVSIHKGAYYAGPIANAAQRKALEAAGQEFHLVHKSTPACKGR